jgi:predicted transposase/invertase (TIGR01784 family)
MKTDSLFYQLFQTLPHLLFDLLDQPIDHAVHYQFTSEELKQTAFRLDGIFHPPDEQPDWPVFFVEVQFQLDTEIYSRLFAEIFLYLRQHRPVHPWHAVVIYPTRSVDPGAHRHYQALLNSSDVTRVYLEEWAQPRQTLSQQLIGLVLAPSSHTINEAQGVLLHLRAAGGIDTGLTTAIVNLVETIVVYKLPTLGRERIQAMLELTDVDLKQTQFYQDVFAEGRQEGEQEGRQKGRQEGEQEGRQKGRQEGEQEGRQKGRQEGELTLILRLLQRRCGELTPTMQERLARLDLPQLEALGEALLDFRGVTDLEQWLATHGQEPKA